MNVRCNTYALGPSSCAVFERTWLDSTPVQVYWFVLDTVYQILQVHGLTVRQCKSTRLVPPRARFLSLKNFIQSRFLVLGTECQNPLSHSLSNKTRHPYYACSVPAQLFLPCTWKRTWSELSSPNPTSQEKHVTGHVMQLHVTCYHEMGGNYIPSSPTTKNLQHIPVFGQTSANISNGEWTEFRHSYSGGEFNYSVRTVLCRLSAFS